MNESADSNNAILQRAYELIEKGNLEQAQEILLPLLESHGDSAALWWVYAHATPDAAIGQAALERVLALDPNYPGARELQAEVQSLRAGRNAEMDLESPLDSAPPFADSDIDDWEDLQPIIGAPPADVLAEDSLSWRQRAVLLLLPITIIVVGTVLITSGMLDIPALLSRLQPQAEPTALSGAAPPTAAPPSAEPAVTEVTETPPTAAATMSPAAISDAPPPTTLPEVALAELSAAAIAFAERATADISEFAIEYSSLETTASGPTLVLHVCALPGEDYNERIRQVLNAVAELAFDIPAGIEAVGAGLQNCDAAAGDVNIIGTSLAILQDYADGWLDSREFQGAWQPLS